MEHEISFGIVETYGCKKFAHIHREKIVLETADRKEAIAHVLEAYLSRIEDGYLPLIPSGFYENEWKLDTTNSILGYDKCGSYYVDGHIHLKYEDVANHQMKLWEDCE